MGLEDLLPISVTWLWLVASVLRSMGLSMVLTTKQVASPEKTIHMDRLRQTLCFFYNFTLEVTKYHLYYILLVTHQLWYKLGGGYTGLEIPGG